MTRLDLMVEPDQLARLRLLSEKTGASIGELVRRAIDAYLRAKAKRATK